MRKLTLLFGLLLTLGSLHAQEKGNSCFKPKPMPAFCSAILIKALLIQLTFLDQLGLFSATKWGSIWELASEPTIAFMSVSNTCLFLPMRNIVSAQERRGHTPKFVQDMRSALKKDMS